MKKLKYIKNNILTKYLNLYRVNLKDKKNKNSNLFFFDRNTVISKEVIGWKINIWNGKIFNSVMVSNEHVGLKLGEFSFTRRRAKHAGKRKKKNKFK